MTIAVMQPYIFPYIGYFQLVNSVDTFVFYDDVNFIKRGWINRNRLLINGKENLFTVPLNKASQNDLILETQIQRESYSKWSDKFLKSLKMAYSKAPHFDSIYELVASVLEVDSTISNLSIESIKKISNYLELKVDFKTSSKSFNDTKDLERAERLMAICEKISASDYINMPGGKDLYDKKSFAERGIKLHFIAPEIIPYAQDKGEFVPGLSIIDVLMYNDKKMIQEKLLNYTLN